ncbi:MAG: hypothetical protein ACO1PB_15510 [Ramlibacter sp.]
MSELTAPTDPAEALTAQAEAIRARFPVPRTEKPAVRAEAEALAQACESLQQPPPELALGVVKLLRKAGSHPLALRLLRQWRPAVAGEERTMLFLEMELSFLTGERATGEALLGQLEAGGKLRPSWERSIARIRQRVGTSPQAGEDGDGGDGEAEPPGAADASAPAALPELDRLAGTLLERVQQISACFPVREAGKFRVRSAAFAAIAEYDADPAPSDELTYAVIRLLGRLKRYGAALELMQRRKPRIEALAVEIDAYEIYLHYRQQQPDEGARLLERFQAAGHQLPYTFRKALGKMDREGEVAAARTAFALVEHDLCELARDVDLAEHLPLVKLLIPAPNLALETLLFVDERLRALRRMESAPQADLQVFDKYHSARLLFAAGFSWSGSGAVSCFLQQHKLVSLPFGTTEMAYLQGREARKGIFAFIRPGVVEADTMRRRLARFLLESIVSIRRQHYSVLKPCQVGEMGCVGALGMLVDDFHAAMLSRDALQDLAVRRRVLGRFMQRMFSVRGGSHVLLNNIFLAPRTALMGTMDDALFIVVERDARDQFTARRIEGAHTGEYTVQSFGNLLKRNRAGFQAIREAVPPERLEEQMMFLHFEDFVRDPALRDKVLQRAGLPADGLVPDPSRFDPAVSARNIGIHRAALTPDEIAYLEAIGIYLP